MNIVGGCPLYICNYNPGVSFITIAYAQNWTYKKPLPTTSGNKGCRTRRVISLKFKQKGPALKMLRDTVFHKKHADRRI